MTKTGLRIAMWAAAAAVAAAAATGAVVATGGGKGQVLSQDDVAQQLADSAAVPTTGPSAPTTPGPSPSSAEEAKLDALKNKPGYKMLTSRGGTVLARCDGGGLATLESWIPNPGYRADNVVRGPAGRASVQFESDTAADIMFVVMCQDGMPVSKEAVEPDDHGRGGGGRN